MSLPCIMVKDKIVIYKVERWGGPTDTSKPRQNQESLLRIKMFLLSSVYALFVITPKLLESNQIITSPS